MPKKNKDDRPRSTPIGYQFDCMLYNIQQDETGRVLITLTTHAAIREDIFSLFNEPLECAIKTLKAKRSNNANSYCWELCAQIAEATKISSQDVYRKAIKERGIYKDYNIEEERAEGLAADWASLGAGWFTERIDFDETGEKIIMRCYYGTSTYNSAQMAQVIDYLAEEAENLGLTTLSEKKKNELIKNWKSESPESTDKQ